MRSLSVLGSCGAYPEPGRACSGFLVEWDDHRVVLDLGYGTLPRLLDRVPDGAVDAVVITHEHPDHCIDLHGLFRMRLYGGRREPKLPLYCTPGVLDRLSGLEPDAQLRDVFDVHLLPGEYSVGPFALSARSLPHFVPSSGIRLQCDGSVLAYTGDTGPDPTLAELGRDADLFVVEATDRVGEAPAQPAQPDDRRRGGVLGAAGKRPQTHADPLLAGQRSRPCPSAGEGGVRW